MAADATDACPCPGRRGRGRRPTGPGPPADRRREPHAGRRGRPAPALSAGRPGAPRRHHRVRPAPASRPWWRPSWPRSGPPAGRSRWWPWTPRRRSPAGRCSVTGCACSRTPAMATCSSARWPRAATPAGWRLTTTAAAAVLDAAGFDLVLIETVGTGQSEVEVAAAADTTVVLEAPEMGDEVQAIKAGLLEVADLVVVNKGDKPGRAADGRPAAGHARAIRRPRRLDPDGAPATARAQAAGRAGHDGLDRRGRARAAGRAGPSPRGRREPAITSQRAADARGGPGPGHPGRPAGRPAAGAAVWRSARPRVIDDVAAHRLDPFAAADLLLDAALERPIEDR